MADTLSMTELAKKYGVTAALLNRNPELQGLFKKILSGPQMSDRDIYEAIANSSWGMNHTSDYLKIERQRAQKPAIFDAAVESRMESLRKKFRASGANVPNDAELRELAIKSVYGGEFVDGKWETYNDEWMNEIVNSAIDWTKTRTVAGVQMADLSGTAEDTVTALTILAREYGINTAMSNKGFTSWLQSTAKGLTDGTIQQQDVDDEVKQIALSAFPGYAQAAARGKTFREWADPVLNAFAQEWEMDVEQIDTNDNFIQQALNSIDKDGNHVPMSAYQAKLIARKSPKWMKTEKAKEEYTTLAQDILRDFGFLG